MSNNNDTVTIAIGAAAAGAFVAALLWNTAAILPVSIVAAAAIVFRPFLNYLNGRQRLQRERLEYQRSAVQMLDGLQKQMIENSHMLSENSGHIMEQINTELAKLK